MSTITQKGNIVNFKLTILLKIGGFMLIIDILSGIILGALSGMGVGGAGLLVIYLTALRGVSQTNAQGINLYFFIFASVSAMFIHAQKRNINYKYVLLSLTGGIPAAYIGSSAAAASNPELLRKIFGAMLIFSGLSVLLKRKKKGSTTSGFRRH